VRPGAAVRLVGIPTRAQFHLSGNRSGAGVIPL